jgi:signal peptidase I
VSPWLNDLQDRLHDARDALRARGPLARAGIVLGALGLTCGLLVLPRVAVVPDDEMAPSLLAGDLVVIVPGTPAPGDVVAVVDPLDPSRWTLRRAEAVGGAIRYEDGAFHTVDTVRVLEMGRDAENVTLQEGTHLTRHALRTVRWEMGERGVPDDAVFLGADARDEALDSRWWGPLPLDSLQGRVALRIGAPQHPWRGWITTAP